MKTAVTRLSIVLFLGSFSASPLLSARAESGAAPDSTSPPVVTNTAVVTAAPAPKLPYGVEEVLTLSRNHVSDDIILTYIQNSGTIYNLSPQDIVYLRNQGVSDRVVNSMVDQRRKTTETSTQVATAIPTSPTVSTTSSVPEAPVAPPPPEYTQTAPSVTTPAPSTVYVMPPPAPVYPAYYYYPGYGYYPPRYYYPGYYGPTVSFGFRFGSGPGYGYRYGWHHH
jgi:hypothetical protein